MLKKDKHHSVVIKRITPTEHTYDVFWSKGWGHWARVEPKAGNLTILNGAVPPDFVCLKLASYFGERYGF